MFGKRIKVFDELSKKNVMRIMKRTLTLLMLTALLTVGCDKVDNEQPAPDDTLEVELTITTNDTVWLESEGGKGVICFTLLNGDVADMEATADVNWITNIAIDDGVVRYVVGANDAEERSGTITLTCGKAEQSVTIKQRARVAAGGGLSTLKSDYNFDIEDGIFVGAYVGDLMGTGCNTCQVYLWEYLDLETGEERGDTFQIDLQLPRGGTDICGTYTEGTTQGLFIPGSAEDVGGQYMQQNSWYITADYANFAPIISGTIKVESEDGVNYAFTIDVKDDSGNAIRGMFKGYGEFTEW